MSDIRTITTALNSYFVNNNINIGANIPTEGKHTVGDIIIKETQVADESIGWICTESGNPGVWSEFGGMKPKNNIVEIEPGSIGMAEIDVEVKTKLMLAESIITYFNEVKEAIENVNPGAKIGNMEDLSTEHKNTVIGAINEVNNEKIGDLSLLTTTEKSTVVNSINESSW